MNHDELRHDPAPDPQLQVALRALGEEPPVEQVDWEALRRSVNERAELPLARRRRAARSATAHRWLRPLIPTAAAAGLVLAVFFGMRAPEDSRIAPPDAEAPQIGFVSAEEALRADLPDDEFILLVSGMANSEELLRLAVEAP
ncbi:hypothetical protein BH24GEM3_BH24GEM3_14520 [soil metagenome]